VQPGRLRLGTERCPAAPAPLPGWFGWLTTGRLARYLKAGTREAGRAIAYGVIRLLWAWF